MSVQPEIEIQGKTDLFLDTKCLKSHFLKINSSVFCIFTRNCFLQTAFCIPNSHQTVINCFIKLILFHYLLGKISCFPFLANVTTQPNLFIYRVHICQINVEFYFLNHLLVSFKEERCADWFCFVRDSCISTFSSGLEPPDCLKILFLWLQKRDSAIIAVERHLSFILTIIRL